MKKVFVVVRTSYWNNEESRTVAGVFTAEADADAAATRWKEARGSGPYAPTYEVEPQEVDNSVEA